MLKINGAELPAPIKYEVGIMDISQAERNAAGKMFIDIIATKRKIELTFKLLSPEETSQLLKKISSVFFTVEYFDPQENALRTGVFYTGDRKINGLTYEDGKLKCSEVSFNLIEQ